MWIAPPPDGHIVETVVIITKAGVTTTEWPGQPGNGHPACWPVRAGQRRHSVDRDCVDIQPTSEAQLNRARFFHGKTKADVKGPGLRGIAFGVEPDGSRVITRSSRRTRRGFMAVKRRTGRSRTSACSRRRPARS